jgi:hypothetical protein
MRTHSTIIHESGGVAAFARKLGLYSRVATVQSWWQRDSIPCEYWLLIDQLDLASLAELAFAAAHRRRPKTASAA